MNQCDLSYCQSLPKVELHAHANGSLSDETVSKLLKKSLNSDLDPCSFIIKKGEQRTMAEGFEMFRIIHELVNNTDVLFDCIQDVISDFATDGVKYLELRSTPREVKATGMTKRSYFETVLMAMQSYMEDDRKPEIIVRYLPSIDRKNGVDNAFEVVKLAEEYMLSSNSGLVVGVDFSGNPFSNNGADYFEPLYYAKKSNLKLAVHMAEVEKCDTETSKLLQLPPDRIGHGTFLSKDDQICKKVLKSKIPIEICMTSNVKTGTAPLDYSKHHLTWWKLENDHPCVLGTDDKGIFATSLSNEYAIAANVMQLTRQELFDWSKSSIEYIFDGQQTKDKLLKHWNESNLNFESVCDV